MANKDVLEMLGSVRLFEDLSKRELRTIREVAKQVEFDDGDDVVEEGASGVGFHLILEGRADVLVGDSKQTTLGPGDYFGEMSLIDKGPRSATVRASGPVRTLSLTSWAFLPLLDEHPSIAKKMLIEMSRRLRNVEQSLRH
jgi:CRP/FNR family transcriptional regulator, cyclic AMP receptor protein